ncbi:MAG: hypothetical protein IMX02_02855 [Limnochordaceae bacterium]|nr:hypothetical protein [Limnochordaceae bacterium]
MLATAKRGKVATLVRMPKELFEAVRERAFRERRSINALLVEATSRYMEQERPAPTPDLKARILAAIAAINRQVRRFGLVTLPELRAALEDVDRATLDAALLELGAERQVQLVPHDHVATLSPEERAACVRDPLGQWLFWVRQIEDHAGKGGSEGGSR